MKQTVLELAQEEWAWEEFIQYKNAKQHLSQKEAEEFLNFIEQKRYLPICELWREGVFPTQCPVKSIVNKEGTDKKRRVYTYSGDEGIFLKFIAFQMFRYDDYLMDNCYAFRRNRGVQDAIKKIENTARIEKKWCLKLDISDYFNSIDTELLLRKLAFIRDEDPGLYQLFDRILSNKRVLWNGQLVAEEHGAMAGIPLAPFFANIYLRDGDSYFAERNVVYFRYSDDILIFEESPEALIQRRNELEKILQVHHLNVNPEKVSVSAPGEYWEYLGFGYRDGSIDLSENTIRKTKARIKRKAEALRRWQRKKGLAEEKAAIGLIHAMNRKFYGGNQGEEDKDFTWSRWFFPCLTTDRGLKQIDSCLQEYIRYAVTGRHYKGNYRIGYQKIKQWGYRSLVHEFWKGKHDNQKEKVALSEKR